MASPANRRSPPTGSSHDGPPVFAVVPESTEPAPPVPSPEPFGAVVVVVGSVVVDDPTDDDVVASSSEDDVDDEVDEDVPAAVSLSSPRLPGLASASASPTTKMNAAAAPRIVSRWFRGETHLACLERVTGVEPASPAWKAGALAIELHPRE